MPDTVIERAKEIVVQLIDADISKSAREIAAQGIHSRKKQTKPDELEMSQMSLFDTVRDEDIANEIKELDLGNMTPIDALNTLYKLQNKLKNRWTMQSTED